MPANWRVREKAENRESKSLPVTIEAKIEQKPLSQTRAREK
jgi:hypothetical protein